MNRLRISLLALLLFANASIAAPSLFSPAPARANAEAEDSQLARLTRLRTTKQLTLIDVNLEALAAPALDLSLPARSSAAMTRAKITRRSAQDYSWHGTLNNIPGDATLVVRDGRVTGTIRHGTDLFRIVPLASGGHALIEVDQRAFPPEDPPSASAERNGLNSHEAVDARLAAAGALAAAPASSTIDLMVVYTNGAQNQAGDIQALIQLAIDETNLGYQNSGIVPRVRLVHSYKVAYTEGTRSYDTILNHLERTNDGQMDEIHALRDQYGADAVLMIMNQDDACGVASTIMANASTAFALVHWDCATGYYSFGHELGHLQGARHDPSTDGTNTPFRYGHGYRYLSQWRTVLAYDCNNDCPRVNRYSNPNVTYNGVPQGTADRSHNARVINETAATVMAWREAAAPEPGGSLDKFIGPACSDGVCTGWQRLDIGRTVSAAAALSNLYQITTDGSVLRYTGTPCAGDVCSGWQTIDTTGNAEMLNATGSRLYQLRTNGDLMRYTGTPGSWERIDIKPNIVVLASNLSEVYQMLSDGSVYRYNGTPCSGTTCDGWRKLANAATSKSISAANNLYRIDQANNILRYTGVKCTGDVCPGWEMIDNSPTSQQIVAVNDTVYQMRGNDSILRYNGTPCSGSTCGGWELLARHTGSSGLSHIAASGTKLYAILLDGTVMRWEGVACTGDVCPPLKKLDKDPDTENIVTAAGTLYQIRGE